jgi:hypothetical protein
MGSIVHSTRSVGFRHMWLRLNASKENIMQKKPPSIRTQIACSCFTSAEYRGISEPAPSCQTPKTSTAPPTMGGYAPASAQSMNQRAPESSRIMFRGLMSWWHENESCKLEGSGFFRRLAEALAYLELVVEPGLHLCSVVERARAVVREEPASVSVFASEANTLSPHFSARVLERRTTVVPPIL